jgi:hypothetical protein
VRVSDEQLCRELHRKQVDLLNLRSFDKQFGRVDRVCTRSRVQPLAAGRDAIAFRSTEHQASQ